MEEELHGICFQEGKERVKDVGTDLRNETSGRKRHLKEGLGESYWTLYNGTTHYLSQNKAFSVSFY